MDFLTENPVLVGILVVLAVAFVGHRVWRWRRESAMRSHAEQQGWRPVERVDTFADLAVRSFPELRQRAEQDARAARSSRGSGGLGATIRVGRSPSGASESRARNAYLVRGGRHR